jgi:predicted RNase H-like HicB family nuclease
MKRPFAATVWREGNWYVSQCLEIDIASQGATEEEALENLREALELHFEPPQATRRLKQPVEKWALRRNPTGWLIDGAFRYTLQFEEQRLDEDSGMAGLPGVSERDP